MGYRTFKAPRPEPPETISIGVLVLDRFFNENAFYNTMYRDLVTACQRKGIVVLMEIVTNEAEWERVVPTLVQTRRVNGLIFMGEFETGYIRAATCTDIPFLMLDFFKDELITDCVVSDNVRGGFTLTEHLLDSGRKKIAFEGSTWATNSIMHRYLGYCKALLLHGMQPRADWRIEDRDREGLFIPFELPEDMPDAFVCNCDEVAYNLVEFLKGTSKNLTLPHTLLRKTL